MKVWTRVELHSLENFTVQENKSIFFIGKWFIFRVYAKALLYEVDIDDDVGPSVHN